MNINTQVILMPPAASDGAQMDSDGALEAASQYADTGMEPTALLARVTVPGTIPPPDVDIPFRTIEDRQAWVVTFTSPKPVFVGSGGKADNAEDARITVTHYSVILDADSGAFLLGFYTV